MITSETEQAYYDLVGWVHVHASVLRSRLGVMLGNVQNLVADNLSGRAHHPLARALELDADLAVASEVSREFGRFADDYERLDPVTALGWFDGKLAEMAKELRESSYDQTYGTVLETAARVTQLEARRRYIDELDYRLDRLRYRLTTASVPEPASNY